MYRLLDDLKKKHIIEQLHNLGYYDTDGKTYKELKHMLVIKRFYEIDHEHSSNEYF